MEVDFGVKGRLPGSWWQDQWQCGSWKWKWKWQEEQEQKQEQEQELERGRQTRALWEDGRKRACFEIWREVEKSRPGKSKGTCPPSSFSRMQGAPIKSRTGKARLLSAPQSHIAEL